MRCTKVKHSNQRVTLPDMSANVHLLKKNDMHYHDTHSVPMHVNGETANYYALHHFNTVYMFVHVYLCRFLQLMTVFFPSLVKETNIAVAHVYFRKPTAKYTLAALHTHHDGVG